MTISLSLGLAACAKPMGFDGSERSLIAVPPDTFPTPKNPKTGDILRRSGKIKAKDLRGTWEKGQFTLEGSVEVLGKPSQKLILIGDVEDGSADLRPSEKSEEKYLRGKAYCYSGDEPCSEFFVDLFVMDENQIIYHDQYVVMSPKSFAPSPTTTLPKPKPLSPVVKDEIEIEDDVQDGEDTGFVGADEDSAKNLFLPPTKSPPKPGDRPAQSTATKNQAVDYCSSGRLQNATDIKKLGLESSSNFKIYMPSRENGYGTFQLANVLQDLGKKVNELMPGSKLAVGAISSKNGGKQKGHKSHQNGNDADISYLVNNSQLEFKSVTTKAGVQSALLVPENWALFKFAFSTGKVEMIFTDSKIKKAICQEAILKGELKDSKDRSEIYSFLSLIRVTPGHDDHFHLRVKCGTDNPLCKTRRYKNLDSGCFVASK